MDITYFLHNNTKDLKYQLKIHPNGNCVKISSKHIIFIILYHHCTRDGAKNYMVTERSY